MALKFDIGAVWFDKNLHHIMRENGGRLPNSEHINPTLHVIEGTPRGEGGSSVVVKSINLNNPEINFNTRVVSRDALEDGFVFAGKHADPGLPIEDTLTKMRGHAKVLSTIETGTARSVVSREVSEKIIQEFFPNVRSNFADEPVYRRIAELAKKANTESVWTEDIRRAFFGDFFDDLVKLHNPDIGDTTPHVQRIIQEASKNRTIYSRGIFDILERLSTYGIDMSAFEQQLAGVAGEKSPAAQMKALGGIMSATSSSVKKRIGKINATGRASQLKYLESLGFLREHLSYVLDRSTDPDMASSISQKLDEVNILSKEVRTMMKPMTVNEARDISGLGNLSDDLTRLSDQVYEQSHRKIRGRALSPKQLEALFHMGVPEDMLNPERIGRTTALLDAKKKAAEIAESQGIRYRRMESGSFVDITREGKDYGPKGFGTKTMRYMEAGGEGFFRDIVPGDIPFRDMSTTEAQLLRQRAMWDRYAKGSLFDAVFFRPTDVADDVLSHVKIRMPGMDGTHLERSFAIRQMGKAKIITDIYDRSQIYSISEAIRSVGGRTDPISNKTFWKAFKHIEP